MKIYSMFQATIQICAQFILNYIILDLLTDIYQLLKTKGLQQKNNQHNVVFCEIDVESYLLITTNLPKFNTNVIL